MQRKFNGIKRINSSLEKKIIKLQDSIDWAIKTKNEPDLLSMIRNLTLIVQKQNKYLNILLKRK